MKRFRTYDQFLNENEDVILASPIAREYVLTHFGDSRFNIKSDNINRDFSVTPYNPEEISRLKEVQSALLDAINSKEIIRIYDAIKDAEGTDYAFGNMFPTKLSLSLVPGFKIDKLENDTETTGRDFLVKDLESIPENIRLSILQVFNDRAEQMYTILTALFYFIDTMNPGTHFRGKNFRKIIEEVSDMVKKVAEEQGFVSEGPYGNRDEKTSITEKDEKAYWHCTKNDVKFQISTEISPSKLNKRGTLRFSIDADEEVPEKYQNLDIENLGNKIKEFTNG